MRFLICECDRIAACPSVLNLLGFLPETPFLLGASWQQ
jgi:hypothetical protein